MAPYGQEDIRGLQSVFEFNHLRGKAVFLDTQCRPPFFNPALHDSPSLDRLPCVIGDFISNSVYYGELNTYHRITDPKACRFIDVRGGNEVKQGHSWVVSLASLRCYRHANGTRTVEKPGLFVISRACINNRTRLIVLLHRMTPSAPPSR